MKELGEMLIESLEKRGAIAMLNDDRRAAVVRAAGEFLDSNIAMRALQVGEAMPDFTLHAATDQLVRLSEVLPAAQPWSASSGVPGASIASPSSVHSPTRTIRSAQPVPRSWPSRRNARNSRGRGRCHFPGSGMTTTSWRGRSAWHLSCRGT